MPRMHYVACSNTLKSPLLIIFVFHLSSALDSCNSCSTKCSSSSSSKWLWEQQLLRGECHSNIPPANQEVRGRGACHSLSPSHERLITLRTLPPATRGHEWSILCSLSASLWRLRTKRNLSFLCLFLADKFVCNGCLWRTKTVSAIEDGVLRTGSPTLKGP